MKHRATSPRVETLRAELIRRCQPYVRIEPTLEQLLAAQDDATLDAIGGRTLGGQTPAVFDLDRYRHSASMVHDDEEAA